MFSRIAVALHQLLSWILRLVGLGAVLKYNDLSHTDVCASSTDSEQGDSAITHQLSEHLHPVTSTGLSESAIGTEDLYTIHGEALQSAGSIPAKPQLVVVMRHGHRQDEEDPSWSQAASRPWDPPLSSKGRRQAEAAAAPMAPFDIDYVIASPFLRCIQTSAAIVQRLEIKPGCWQLDWGLCEVCSARNMSNGNNMVLARIRNGSQTADWMWEGRSKQEAVETFIAEDPALSSVGFKPIWRNSTPPHFPESLEMGLARYGRCLQGLMQEFEGCNILVVGHGECMRQAVKMMEPDAEVYEVAHTGYVLLQRDRVHNLPWMLGCASGETGVSWFT